MNEGGDHFAQRAGTFARQLETRNREDEFDSVGGFQPAVNERGGNNEQVGFAFETVGLLAAVEFLNQMTDFGHATAANQLVGLGNRVGAVDRPHLVALGKVLETERAIHGIPPCPVFCGAYGF